MIYILAIIAVELAWIALAITVHQVRRSGDAVASARFSKAADLWNLAAECQAQRGGIYNSYRARAWECGALAALHDKEIP